MLFRPRTIAYFAIWGGIGAALLFMLGARERLTISVARDRNPEFVQLSDGAVRNAFTVNLRNMQDRPRTLRISAEHMRGAALYSDEMASGAAQPELAVTVPADSMRRVRLYVVVPAEHARPHEFIFVARPTDKEGGEVRRETKFMAPEPEHHDDEHEESE